MLLRLCYCKKCQAILFIILSCFLSLFLHPATLLIVVTDRIPYSYVLWVIHWENFGRIIFGAQAERVGVDVDVFFFWANSFLLWLKLWNFQFITFHSHSCLMRELLLVKVSVLLFRDFAELLSWKDQKYLTRAYKFLSFWTKLFSWWTESFRSDDMIAILKFNVLQGS